MKLGVIGSINIDFVYQTDTSPRSGETVVGTKYDILNGGKGANQAVIASAITSDLVFLGALGKDTFANQAKKHLVELLGNANCNIKEKNTTTGMAIVELSNRDNRITVIPGANLWLNNTDVLEFLDKYKDLIVVVLQLEVSVSVVEFAIEECYRRGIKTILNPAPVQILNKEVLNKVTYLIPNESEFAKIFGHRDYRSEIESAGGRLLVTLGEKGVAYYDDSTYKLLPAKEIELVDTTGAGDPFIAGFATGVYMGFEIEDSINIGINAASITCENIGAQGGYKKIRKIYQNNK